MASTVLPKNDGTNAILRWSRLRFIVVVSAVFGLLLSIDNETATLIVFARAIVVGMAALMAFGVLERWPRRLPRKLPRSVLQLIGIVATIPVAAVFAYVITTGGNPRFSEDRKQLAGLAGLVFTGILFAPWIAVGAMLKQRDAFAREQALAFELERSEFERKAVDAKLRLLQAQIEPHFLFNTLANVQALVDAGSPQASRVLASLIAYLRAAVPRMHEQSTTLGQEMDLVRAYLELMQMRMPDRLQFALHLDPSVTHQPCPPMTLLTLVENAVRHGIDPSEIGGRIDIDAWLRDGRVLVRVTDTGVGLKTSSGGLGTGLATLRERMQLAFAGDVRLQLIEIAPHGVCAELNFPARPI